MGPLGGFWPKLVRKRVTGWKQRSCVPPGRVKTNKQTNWAQEPRCPRAQVPKCPRANEVGCSKNAQFSRFIGCYFFGVLTKLHSTDGSEAMLEKLKEKGIYGKAIQAILGNKDVKINEDILDESYDVAIIMGGFAQSHLPIESLYQVARTLKKGI
jgi:hypothetical protein